MVLLLLWLLVKFFSKGKKACIQHAASEKNKVLINPPSFVCFVVKWEPVKICPAAIWTMVEKLMKTSPSLNF